MDMVVVVPVLDTNHAEGPQVWIGLVEMLPRPNVPNGIFRDGIGGGFCQVLAWCCSRDDFAEQVKRALEHYKLDVGDLSDVEPLLERMQKHGINDRLMGIASEVEETRIVRFDEEIHVYPPGT